MTVKSCRFKSMRMAGCPVNVEARCGPRATTMKRAVIMPR